MVFYLWEGQKQEKLLLPTTSPINFSSVIRRMEGNPSIEFRVVVLKFKQPILAKPRTLKLRSPMSFLLLTWRDWKNPKLFFSIALGMVIHLGVIGSWVMAISTTESSQRLKMWNLFSLSPLGILMAQPQWWPVLLRILLVVLIVSIK